MAKILKMICHLLHIAAKRAKFGFFRFFRFIPVLPVFPAKKWGGGAGRGRCSWEVAAMVDLEPYNLFFSLFE